MKKTFTNVTLCTALLVGLSGCMGNNDPKPHNNNNATQAKLGNGSLLAYAYLKNGETLLSLNDIPQSDDVETVLITTRGFYPNYRFSGDRSQECGRYYKHNKLIDFSEKDFCKSHYTHSKASSAVGDTLWNSLFVPLAAVTNPVNTAKGKPLYQLSKSFDKEEFLKVMDENNLPQIRKKLLKLNDIILKNERTLHEMYQPYFKKYKENLSHIHFIYNVQDKTGLLPSKNIDPHYRVVLDAPQEKRYNYHDFLTSLNATPQNFENRYQDTLNKLQHQFEEDKKNYQKYLETAFTSYKIEGPSNYSFQYNTHVSFETTIKAPSEIKYKYAQDIKIPITVLVTSATLQHMIPKKFQLQDTNIQVDFILNDNATVSAIAQNKTQHFITIKSLTSYYRDDVYNISKIDREISPETTTLSANSNYTLLSNKMIQKSNFKNITRAKAKQIHINYGYAIKYRLNNTNINKSIYHTNKYSLYSIIKEYL